MKAVVNFSVKGAHRILLPAVPTPDGLPFPAIGEKASASGSLLGLSSPASAIRPRLSASLLFRRPSELSHSHSHMPRLTLPLCQTAHTTPGLDSWAAGRGCLGK